MAGMSGKDGARLAVLTARPRKRPDFTKGITDTVLVNVIATCPDTKSVTAGPAPLYGTCTMSIFAMNLSSSPDILATPPVPAEA